MQREGADQRDKPVAVTPAFIYQLRCKLSNSVEVLIHHHCCNDIQYPQCQWLYLTGILSTNSVERP